MFNSKIVIKSHSIFVIAKLFLEERCKLGFPLMNDRDAARKWVEELTPDN